MKLWIVISSLLFTFGCAHVGGIAAAQVIQDARIIESKYKNGTAILIVAHPFCHFSENAFRDFSTEMSRKLKDAVIVAPINPRHLLPESKAVDHWNRVNPFEMLKVSQEMQLVDIDLNHTPQFYFFKDGVLKKKIVGWPNDKSNLKQVSDALDQLMPAL